MFAIKTSLFLWRSDDKEKEFCKIDTWRIAG
jgi:hypothetical protein